MRVKREKGSLYEYITLTNVRGEADEPEQNQTGMVDASQTQQDGNGVMPPEGGDAAQQNDGMDAQDGGQMTAGENGMLPMNGGMDSDAGQDGVNMDVTQGMDIPDADMGTDGIENIEMDDDDTMQDGDEVIDVDELTQSQEAAEYKIDGVDDKLTTLGAVVAKFIEALKQNDAKIDSLKAEFEKRNPTDEERLNIRSQSSVPYMETPKEYWDGVVSRNPRYNVMYDNTVKPKDEERTFELRKSELSAGNDRDISDSFEYPTNLKDILDF